MEATQFHKAAEGGMMNLVFEELRKNRGKTVLLSEQYLSGHLIGLRL